MESWEDGQDEEELSDDEIAAGDPYHVDGVEQEEQGCPVSADAEPETFDPTDARKRKASEDPCLDELGGVPVAAALAEVKAAKERPEIVWEAFSSKGAAYYHNPATGESRWQLPTGPFDVVVPAGAIEARKRAKLEEAVQEAKGAKTSKAKKKEGELPAEKAEDDAGGDHASASSSSSAKAGSSSASDSSSEDGRKKQIAGFKRLQAKLEDFKKMLQERRIKQFDKFAVWAPRLAADSRFLAVPVDIRKQLFAREVQRIADEQRQVSTATRRESCKAFSKLLTEASEKDLFRGAKDVATALQTIENGGFGDDARWHATPSSDRERLAASLVEDELRRQRKEEQEAARAFRVLLHETVLNCVEGLAEPPPWPSVRREQKLRMDPRYKAIGSDITRGKIYAEAAADHLQKRVDLQKREVNDEVELAITRDLGSLSTAEAGFRALLAEHIKTPLKVTWAEACVLLDSQTMPAGLDEAGRERIFNEVCHEEAQRAATKFLQGLRQAPTEIIGAEMDFTRVCEILLKRTPTLRSFLKCNPPLEVRDAWEAWRRQALEEAAADFRAWLPRCPHISGVAGDGDAKKGQGAAFEALCKKLAEEPAWKRLAAAPAKRRKIVAERLQEASLQKTKSAGLAAAVMADEDYE